MSNIKTKEPTTESDFLEEVKTSNPEEYEYFEKQQADLDEIDGLISEEFDATGDESMMRVMKMFDDYNRETEGYLQKIQRGGKLGRWDGGEIKTGEMPSEPEVGDLSDLFTNKIMKKRTSFLDRQLKKFKDWRARNKSNPEITDELDGDDVFGDMDALEQEFKAFNDQTDIEVNEMMGESKEIEMTPRGNPAEITPEEADLFDDLNLFGESKSSGNLEAFGEGKLPPEISQSGFSAEELGVEMSGDDFIITEGGEVLDLTGVEGEEMLGRIASVVASNAEATGAVARGLSVAGDALGVVGIGLAVGSTIYQIYDGISTENKYEEAGDTYIKMGGDITKINEALRTSYNNNAKQMNAYTQLYHKWVFQKSDPTQEDKGRQMPLFNYSSNFDSISEDQRMDKISTFMISSVIQKQQRDLSKIDPMMRTGLQALYNQQNERLKKNIIEGLDRVSQGKENTQYNWIKDMIGTDPDSTDNLMGVDIEAQKAGGIKLKAIYDAYREMDLRNKFMTKAYNLNLDTKEAQDERFQLNTIDHRMLDHFEEQTNDDPAFQSALQARTDEINKKYLFNKRREYDGHLQKINKKYLSLEKTIKVMPMLPEKNKAQIIKSYEEKRRAEWRIWNDKKNKALRSLTISKEQVAQNNYPKRYQFMINLKKSQPYWIEYYKKNRKKYYDDDMNEILSNRKKWLEGSDTKKRRTGNKSEDVAPSPYTGDDDSDDYNPFINPKKDIKRTLNPNWKPPKPVVPKPHKPDDPVKPKPAPLPPAPKRRKPSRQLLGMTNFDFEPEKDNEFDDDIAFDINLAIHMLHLCEHSYKTFEDNNYFPTSEVFDYDEATTMGSENFAVTEQGRMYYSSEDNVISIAYRGTDFGRTYSRPDLFVADLMNDISVRKVNYEGLVLHSGFLDFFLKTQVEVMEFINSHINKDTLIYTTGHSYGAIPSMILAFILNKHYGERRAINYTFGSPRGMDRESVRIVATQLTAFRIADIQDPITLLPPSGTGYYHAGRTIYLNGEIMKEIIDMDEADRLYNIAGSTIAGVVSYQAVSLGIIGLLKYTGTPEQSALSTRMGGMFYNMYETGMSNLSPTQMGSNIKNFFGWVLASMSKTQPRRSGRLRLRTGSGDRTYQVGRQISQFQKDTIVNRFIGGSKRVGSAMRNWDMEGMDWIDYMKNEGLTDLNDRQNIFNPKLISSHAPRSWTESFFKKINRADKSYTREKVEGFLQEMEMMMFPDKITEYQDLMKSWNLGFLLNLFPTKVQLKSSALTAGGLFALFKILEFSVLYPMSFIELNKHALEKYDELLEHHTHKEMLHGSNVRTEKEMLKDADAVKDGENNFYSTTQDEHEGTPIFTQTDNDHLKFMPKYHKDTGMTMMPIPHDLRQAILGFVVLSDEQYESKNMIKGVVVY